MIAGLQTVPCYLCGSTNATAWAAENGYSAQRCTDCRAVYVSPRPPADSIAEAAMTGEHEIDRDSINVTGRSHPVRTRRLRRIVTTLFDVEIRSGRPIRWLDVGAGFGELILVLRQTLPVGSVIEGMEPNVAKRAMAASQDVRLLDSLKDVEGEFDVISLMNVFSHLPDPVGFIGDLRDRRAPGGGFLLETGNLADLDRRSQYPDQLFLPDHLVFAAEEQLAVLASKLGLRQTGVARYRTDGPRNAIAELAKMVLRRPHQLFFPYTSRFRGLATRMQP